MGDGFAPLLIPGVGKKTTSITTVLVVLNLATIEESLRLVSRSGCCTRCTGSKRGGEQERARGYPSVLSISDLGDWQCRKADRGSNFRGGLGYKRGVICADRFKPSRPRRLPRGTSLLLVRPIQYYYSTPADLVHSVQRLLFDHSVSHLQIGICFPVVFNCTRASPQHDVAMRRFA